MDVDVEWEGKPSLAEEVRPLTALYIRAWVYQAGKSLSSRTSQWPARRGTANRGPYSEQVSVDRWYMHVRRLKDAWLVTFRNHARNSDGKPYARYVNEGVVSSGRISDARYRANFDAGYRTIKRNEEKISSDAERMLSNGST